MPLQMKLISRTRAGVLSALLALLYTDSTAATKDPMRWAPSSGVHIERVVFVLDQDAQTKEEEAQKKRKAEQHRAATAKTKPAPKAASAAAASITQPTASQPQTAASSAAAARAQPAASEASPSASPSRAAASAVTASSVTASSPAVATAGAVAALGPSRPGNAPLANGSGPARLTRDQLIALMPGATMRRTNTAGALRQWVNGTDGKLTVYWAGGGFLNSNSASGKWSVTEDGHFCLQIDWPDTPENWCRFLEPTANGAYQPVPDVADATWTPPKDKTEWRSFTVRR